MVDYTLLDGLDVKDKEFYGELPRNQPVSLAPVFSGEAFQQAVAYGVIVEGWRKKHRTQGSRRIRLAYEAAFTHAERETIGRWHTKFEQWYLVTGVPNRIMLRLSTLYLLKRAVHFFATI